MHQSNTLRIDRTKPFNPAQLIGRGWSIAEEDERSLALTEIDLGQVQLRHMLRPGETWVKGEEKLARLKDAGLLRLDARVLEALWADQSLIPESWKEKTDGLTTFVFFDGTVLLDPFGLCDVLCLFWDGGRWHWDYDWLELGWDVNDRSAVLAS